MTITKATTQKNSSTTTLDSVNSNTTKSKSLNLNSIESNKKIWVPCKLNLFKKAYLTPSSQIINEDGTPYPEDNNKEYVPANPSKFDLTNDLSALSYLNEFSVINNLELRYFENKIYTKSGIFLVAINPYRRLNIYGDGAIKEYVNKDCNIPHIYQTASEAYNTMIGSNENQSILITGESGAGKTENTKKVIKFLSKVSKTETNKDSETKAPTFSFEDLDDNSYLNTKSSNSKNRTRSMTFIDPESFKTKQSIPIEDLIFETTQLLEFFGNAKTMRNSNSSRFGKFIKVHFTKGELTGATISKYLLEKSRVTRRNAGERNYHIFHNLVSCSKFEKLKLKNRELNLKNLVETNKSKYLEDCEFFDTKESNSNIKYIENSLTHLGINSDKVFKILISIILLGALRFSEKEEQAFLEKESEETLLMICELLGINRVEFVKYVLYPNKEINKENVRYSRSANKAYIIIEALSRYMYESLFDFIISKVNISTSNLNISNINSSNSNFIGILDIAGFEIFDNNSFEQLCINYTNEKLQQFFNHHMFVLEQEIYAREKIEWEFIDFGLDLQGTIDSIEGIDPIGVYSLLDEESIMPQCSENNFIFKLKQSFPQNSSNNNLNSSINKNNGNTNSIVNFNNIDSKEFSIKHYAGIVNYNTDNWISKNKDSKFSFYDKIFEDSDCNVIREILYCTNSDNKATNYKKGYFKTISQIHKTQLNILMANLKSTNPHFVRCILPNENKSPSEIDRKLLLKQLRCNGVLEGIRISRLGYPSRMSYEDFKKRYYILIDDVNKSKISNSKNFNNNNTTYGNSNSITDIDITKLILKNINITNSQFKLGTSKIFLRVGVIADLEDRRHVKTLKLYKIINKILNTKKENQKKMKYEIRQNSSKIIKQNVIKFLNFRQNKWWKLYLKIKPLLDINRKEKEMKDKDIAIKDLNDTIKRNDECINNLKNIIIGNNSKVTELEELRNEERIRSLELEGKLEIKIKEISKMNKINSEIENSRNEFAESLKLKNVENLELIGNLEQLKLKIEDLNTELSNINTINNNLNAEMDTLKITNNENLKLISQLEMKLQLTKTELDSEKESILLDKQKIITDLNIELTDKDSKINNLEKKYENIIKCSDNLKEEINNINLKNSKLTKNKIELENNNKELTDLNTSNANKLKEYENKISELKNNINLNDIKLKELNTNNEDLIYQIQILNSDEIKLKQEIVNSEEKIILLESNIEVLNKKIQNNEKMYEEELKLKDEEFKNNKNYEKETENILKMKALEKKLKNLTKILNNEREENEVLINERSKSNNNWLLKINKLVEENNNLEKEKRQECYKLNIQIRKLEREKNKYKMELDQKNDSSSDDFNLMVMKDKIEISELRKKLINKENEVMELKSKTNSFDNNLIKNLESELIEISDDLNNFVNKASKEMLNDLINKDVKIKNLFSDNLNELANNNVLKKEIRDLKELIVFKDDKIKHLEEEENLKSKFSDQIRELKKQIVELKFVDKKNYFNSKKYEDEIIEIRKVLKDKEDEVNDLKGKVLDLKFNKIEFERQKEIENFLKNVVFEVGNSKNDNLENNVDLEEVKKLRNEVEDKDLEIMKLKMELSRAKKEEMKGVREIMGFLKGNTRYGGYKFDNSSKLENNNSKLEITDNEKEFDGKNNINSNIDNNSDKNIDDESKVNV